MTYTSDEKAELLLKALSSDRGRTSLAEALTKNLRIPTWFELECKFKIIKQSVDKLVELVNLAEVIEILEALDDLHSGLDVLKPAIAFGYIRWFCLVWKILDTENCLEYNGQSGKYFAETFVVLKSEEDLRKEQEDEESREKMLEDVAEFEAFLESMK